MRKANLKGADLTEANLQWVDLSDADLTDAKLIKAKLANANLNSCGFIGAHMAGANLEEANVRSNYFSNADLTGANLQKADIYLANFDRANLTEVNLKETDVYQTRLKNTKLIWADLRGAKFATSSLEQADMRWARLNETDFRDASMGGTILAEVDLSETKGLDEMYINSPLVIDFSTVYRSKGNIPEEFLRRAGVPEEMIDMVHSFSGKFNLIRTYIAYTNEETEPMKKLKGDLTDSGVTCWPYYLDAMSHWLYKGSGLFEYWHRIWDRLIVICSRRSFGHQYLIDALNKELDLEIKTGRDDLLIPICLDDDTVAIWDEYNEKNEHKKKVYDLRQWQEPETYKKVLQELTDDLKATYDKRERSNG
jgi:hypothetical protein